MTRIDLFVAIEAFVCAVEEGSLSSAARRLDKTPSAVTKAIAGLEASLGVRLFERTTRTLALTESGRLYLATATEVLQRLADGARQLSEHDDEPRGPLRVTAAHSFGQAVLAPVGAAYSQAFAHVQLDVALSDRYIDIVGEGFDLALRMGNYDLPSQIVKPIGSNRSLLCASPAYLARRGVPASPRELARHTCIAYRHPALSSVWHFGRDDSAPDEVAVEPRGAIATDSYDLARAAAIGGAGILPCLYWSVVPELESGRLVPLLTDWRFRCPCFGEDLVCAVYPVSRRGSAKVLKLIEMLQARLADDEARVATVTTALARATR
ncbi:MAG TPA: LysR family transcriptional regulator [Paraburkholderia sp.]|uniref:LysR family transcriptional regulator n=1 Tax=Paraburkholderia sp. TaxID=1926495 RepID=UPI002C3EF568|nr:LysR family transcriptional regulator [Paraburkholderia sp.]HTR07780.1 LysR family transcriptional regulator [Paraburkholderia sp.]